MRTVTFLVLGVIAASAQPVVPASSVVNNASFAIGTTPLAPGTIAAIFGSNLDDGSKNPFSSFGPNGELLTKLGGASVSFNGTPAPIFSAFPGQLNVQIPMELAGQTTAQVVVTVGNQSSAAQTVPIGAQSPGIFTTTQTGKGQGAVQIANSSTYAAPAGSISGSQTRAVKPGEFVTIFCTGLGAVNDPPGTGRPASSNPLSKTLITPAVSVGGVNAPVSFSGLAPGFVGEYQVDVQIPQGAPSGSAVPVTLSIDGVQSNTVTIAVAGQVGLNRIAGGDSHTCAVNNAGGVLCWGSDGNGELGNGANAESDFPAPVSGLSSGVVAVATGQNFSCALTKAGGVMCWGRGGSGDLGNNATNDSNVPVAVLNTGGTAPLGGIVQISTGQDHACALTNAGGVLCWGDNLNGAIGNNSGDSQFTTPQQVVGLTSGVVEVEAGNNYSCAVMANGGAMCWGLTGPLGAGSGSSATPIPVLNPAGSAPLTGVVAISAGYQHACALLSNGSELCWGANGNGGLGNGGDTDSALPVQVLNVGGSGAISGLTAITTGNGHSCALTDSAGVLCWGWNSTGEVGDNLSANALTPAQVIGLSSGVVALGSGYRHNCVITSDGGMMCWGDDVDGELGNNRESSSRVPVAVVGVGGNGLLNVN